MFSGNRNVLKIGRGGRLHKKSISEIAGGRPQTCQPGGRCGRETSTQSMEACEEVR